MSKMTAVFTGSVYRP